ncbi:MAG: hypothetical protein R3266_04425 [Gemmatimonadota bacterium]|nr:hypothetical protein [Gemmatimonadota bacterium]
MLEFWKITGAVAGLALIAGVTAFSAPRLDGPAPQTSVNGEWHIEAEGARIIGGFGDNFAYDGEDVRPLEGKATMRLDPEAGTGRLEIELRTTPASGPIQFSKDQAWEGEIRIVQRLNTSQMDMARIAEDIWLHGDTGNEAPVMPKLYNYFATWGPSKIWVNGEEVVPMIGSHTMFSEQARGESGKIVNAEGRVYSPRLDDKTGFADSSETEFHYVAHTTEPSEENFPPHTAWIHLHFSDVEVEQKPDDIEIPYTSQ